MTKADVPSLIVRTLGVEKQKHSCKLKPYHHSNAVAYVWLCPYINIERGESCERDRE